MSLFQPALLTTLFIIQIVIFLLCICGTFFIYMFWDAPDQYPTFAFSIFQYLLLAFPILAIISGILVTVKKNYFFLLLPLIVSIPILILVLLYFSTNYKLSYIDHNRAIVELQN
jgi:uncharacterized membrane protein